LVSRARNPSQSARPTTTVSTTYSLRPTSPTSPVARRNDGAVRRPEAGKLEPCEGQTLPGQDVSLDPSAATSLLAGKSTKSGKEGPLLDLSLL
jgi:hypothetical protein